MQETAVTQVAFPALTPRCAGLMNTANPSSPLSFKPVILTGVCVRVCKSVHV